MAVRVPESKRKSRDDDGIPWGIVAVVLLVGAFGFALWGFHSRQKPVPEGHGSAACPNRIFDRSRSKGPAGAGPGYLAADSCPGPSVSARAAGRCPGGRAPAAVPAANAGAFQVLIQAREDSWVSITADGKQIFQDTLTAPVEKSVEARSEIVIKTGNAGALDISFNGKKLPSQGSYNQVKTITFDPNGLRP